MFILWITKCKSVISKTFVKDEYPKKDQHHKLRFLLTFYFWHTSKQTGDKTKGFFHKNHNIFSDIRMLHDMQWFCQGLPVILGSAASAGILRHHVSQLPFLLLWEVSKVFPGHPSVPPANVQGVFLCAPYSWTWLSDVWTKLSVALTHLALIHQIPSLQYTVLACVLVSMTVRQLLKKIQNNGQIWLKLSGSMYIQINFWNYNSQWKLQPADHELQTIVSAKTKILKTWRTTHCNQSCTHQLNKCCVRVAEGCPNTQAEL